MKTPITPQGLPPYIYGWEAGPNEKVWNEAAVRAALAAQAATLESIHKIIECAGPEAADEIADLLGYPSVEWPSDQALTAPNLACKSAQARLATQWGYVRAASVEPVGRVARVEWCAHEQKWRHVIWADKKVPFGTPVFASAPPSPANVPGAVEPLTKDDIDKLAEVLEVTSLDEVEPETVYAFTRAIEARFAPQPQAVVASSPSPASVPVLVTSVMGLDVYVSPNGEPEQAVPDGWALARAQDTSDYSRETIPEQVEDSLHCKIMNLRCMPDHEIEQAHEHSSPRFAYKCGHRDARHAAAELAALQASHQPQAQQDWALDVEALATKERS